MSGLHTDAYAMCKLMEEHLRKPGRCLRGVHTRSAYADSRALLRLDAPELVIEHEAVHEAYADGDLEQPTRTAYAILLPASFAYEASPAQRELKDYIMEKQACSRGMLAVAFQVPKLLDQQEVF